MLETIRGYGLERLAASGEMEIARQEHAAYYLRLAEQTAEELDGPQQAVWFERLMREHENLRAVLHWSLEQAPVGEAEHPLILGLRLAKAMRAFWVMRGFCREGLDFLQRVLARGEGIISTSERARALDQAGSLAHFLGKIDRAEALLRESLRLRRELADAKGIASSLLRLGMIVMGRGDFPAARSLTEEGLLLFRTQENQERITWALFQLTGIVCKQGDYSLAYTLGKECLVRYKEQGDTKGVANSLYQLAEVLFDSGGDLETAHSLLQEAAELFEQVDDKSPFYLVLPGLVALQRGDVATARLLAEESLSRAREGDAPDDLALALALAGRVNARQGDLTAARAFYEESLSIARQMDFKERMALGLECLAVVVAAQGEPRWAVRLCGAAEALRELMGAPLPAVWRADYEQVVAVARSALKERTFLTLWAEGRSLSLEHILADQEPKPVLTAPSSRMLTLALASYTKLTSRELEVLRLLAQGLTSVQIAEQLVIGLVTVNSHVRSIYSKLGVTSRAAATRYAIEHHLV